MYVIVDCWLVGWLVCLFDLKDHYALNKLCIPGPDDLIAGDILFFAHCIGQDNIRRKTGPVLQHI